MIPNALIAACHFIAAFTLAGALVAESMLLRGRVDGPVIERLLRTDLIYGLSAIAVLAFGLCRAFFFEKPVVFYLYSAPFWVKLGLFAIIGLLSIAPTLAFFRARNAARIDPDYGMAPNQVAKLRHRVALELALLLAMLPAASLMAKGIGWLG